MLKAGLVGAGHLGKIHLKLLEQSAKYELIGFYDNDIERGKSIEKEFSYPFFQNFDELLSKIDVLDIVTPTFAHYEYAIKAIKNHKHFFIEKPLVSSLKEADEIIHLAEKEGVKGQVGHVERFNPAFIACEPFIKDPMFLEIHRLSEFNPRGTDVPVVLDLMIHDLDIVLSIVKSKIKHISASGVAIVSKTPDIANARIEFENSCVVNMTSSRISMKNMRKTRIFQKDAYISINFLDKKSEIIRIKDAPAIENPFDMIIENSEKEKKQIIFENINIKNNNAILDELESLANSIEKNIPVKVSLKQGREALSAALEIIDQIQHQLN